MTELLLAVAPDEGLQRIALALGALGSFLGFLNLGIRVFEVWRDRATIRLSLSRIPALRCFPEPTYFRITATQCLGLTITNLGRRPVQISEAGLLFQDGSVINSHYDQLMKPVLPATLDERNPSVIVSYDYLRLRAQLSEVGHVKPTRLHCWLGTGKHKTTPIDENWLRLLTTPLSPEEVKEVSS